ncbi:hypothetical protein RUM43_013103 [Polyplax serrata]|uniref:Uncharacterized protein n=1 Tax=Polyplax serrata TaxID=468196 RepID=A0AAN8S2Y8_POLSC
MLRTLKHQQLVLQGKYAEGVTKSHRHEWSRMDKIRERLRHFLNLLHPEFELGNEGKVFLNQIRNFVMNLKKLFSPEGRRLRGKKVRKKVKNHHRRGDEEEEEEANENEIST